jgi:hypothetical protein
VRSWGTVACGCVHSGRGRSLDIPDSELGERVGSRTKQGGYGRCSGFGHYATILKL